VRPELRDRGQLRLIKKVAEDAAKPEAVKKDPTDITIVAIGASAGGIEASTELLSYLPSNTGLAFVLIQHLDPTHQSLVTELRSRKTAMAVHEVKHGMTVAANAIYVVPPNTSMTISGQTLQLSPRVEVRGLHMAVDHFMRVLAQQKGNRAIGVILSGSGWDGTLGIGEIQSHGGMTLRRTKGRQIKRDAEKRFSRRPGGIRADTAKNRGGTGPYSEAPIHGATRSTRTAGNCAGGRS
jgi:chemotaxis response regulator CheB